MQVMFAYPLITMVQVLHCLLPTGEKRKKASLLVSSLASISSLAKGACDKAKAPMQPLSSHASDHALYRSGSLELPFI